ncbi:MAG: hypothetical protein ACI9KS_001381 [Sulfitobacter sp.]
MRFEADGWTFFPAEDATQRWVEAVLPLARTALETSERRHGRTWAPGVDLLANGANGAVPGGPPLRGEATSKAQSLFTPLALHRAQISAVWSGYPQRDAAESEANHRYRAKRDAAHIDGLLPEGPNRRRHLREAHAWVLGVGLGEAVAAPLVIWPGSVSIFRTAFRRFYGPHPVQNWGDLDVTDLYQSLRRDVFETCARIEVPLCRGEAILLDRHMLHGTAPWADSGQGCRITAFFRPELPHWADWV